MTPFARAVFVWLRFIALCLYVIANSVAAVVLGVRPAGRDPTGFWIFFGTLTLLYLLTAVVAPAPDRPEGRR